jgi:hypothetical protein
MIVPRLDGGMPLGVLSTPVADITADPPRVYVASLDSAQGWQAWALDLGSGTPLPAWPVPFDSTTVASVDANGPASFAGATVLSQRSALALSPGGDLLYVSFGAYFDGGVGWMVALDTRRAAILASFSGAPSTAADANGGMWAAGGAAVDRNGIVYMTTGNSPDGAGAMTGVWGESLLAWMPTLGLAATYTPWNYCQLDHVDNDLGGSSPVLFDLDVTQTATPHLMALGGKQGNVYLLDRDHLPGRTDARPPCGTDPSIDSSLLPPGSQPQFGTRGPLNVFGPYSDAFGNLDYAKMRSSPALFRGADGSTYLFVSGATKAAVDSIDPVPPSVVRLKVVATPGAPAYLAVDGADHELALLNTGSPVVSSNGGKDAIVWVLDENARRVASLVDPAAPHPILYALDGMTLRVLWHTSPSDLSVGGKYSVPLVARGVVMVATDRLQAFGVR